MHAWAIRLARAIPTGLVSRRETFLLGNLNINGSELHRPAWLRWKPKDPGVWLHVAIIPHGDNCKGGALVRDQHGRFLHALVLCFPKTIPHREFIQFVEIAIQAAHNLNISVKHIISSHIKVAITSQLSAQDDTFYSNVVWDNASDNLCWKGSSNGTFSVKEFIKSFATKHPVLDWARCIWNKWLSPRVSVLMWRLFLGGLPTDDTVKRMGIPIISRCHCCLQSDESIAHLFFKGKWALEMWGFLHRNFGTHKPMSISSFRRYWCAPFCINNQFHCFCFGMACCGIWEIWNLRNASMHGNRVEDLGRRMLNWAIVLGRNIIPGSLSRQEAYLLNGFISDRSSLDKAKWKCWTPCSPGNWLHIATIDSGDMLKFSVLIRDQRGGFLHALVDFMQKSNSLSELIQVLEYGLRLAERRRINVKHIVSSHVHSFRYNAGQDNSVPWDILFDVRRLDRSFGPFEMYRVAACNNNAAYCLAFSSPSQLETNNIIELSLAVRQCIRGDSLGLANCSNSIQTTRYQGGLIADDSHISSRRGLHFSDDMGIGIR